jgi:hypothetical protein
MSDEPETVEIVRDQALKLMAICALLKQGDIDIRGHDQDDVERARETLYDVGEECALLFGGLTP